MSTGFQGVRKYNDGVRSSILKLFIVVIPIQAFIIFFLVFSNALGASNEPVFIAVRWTAGSLSPFSPILFLLPALAIILKEPASHLWIYTFLVAISLIGNHLFPIRILDRYERDPGLEFTYLATTIISLAIATYIGLITQ